MENKCIQIIKTKSFHSLENDEKELIKKWCENEEEFNSMKKLFFGIDAYKNITNKKTTAKTKASLDVIFDKKFTQNPSKQNGGVIKSLFPPFQPFYLQAGYQIAALLVIAILLVPKLLVNTNNSDNKILAKNIKNDNKKKETTSLKSEQNRSVNIEKPSTPLKDTDAKNGSFKNNNNILNSNDDSRFSRDETKEDEISISELIVEERELIEDDDRIHIDGAGLARSSGNLASPSVSIDDFDWEESITSPISRTPEIFDLLTALY